MSRQVTCKIEGQQPEPLGGGLGTCSPGKFLKRKSPGSIFSRNLEKKSCLLIPIIVKKNDTLGEFVYFTIQLELHQNTAFVLRASFFLTVTS